jgi:tripartite-type tricarboxylate transporter receptor subunit TctC
MTFSWIRTDPARRALAVLLAIGTSTWAVGGAAQAWPQRPLRVVVPFPAGGIVDIIARTLAEPMAKSLGQPWVVENLTGASGSIGTDAVARAPADGHTLLLASPSHTTNPSLVKALPWHPLRSFSPVTMVGSIPNMILVHPVLPVKSVRELVALAKRRPGELNYASAGPGSAINLAAEMLRTMAGIDVVHVPYRGQPEALAALVAGEVQFMPLTVALAEAPVRSGRARALAVTSNRRLQAWPDLPTVAESGYPAYEVSTWFAFLATAGTPEAAVSRLNGELRAALRTPAVEKRLLALGMVIEPGTSAELATFLERDVERWAKVVRAAGIAPQ